MRISAGRRGLTVDGVVRGPSVNVNRLIHANPRQIVPAGIRVYQTSPFLARCRYWSIALKACWT